MWNQKFLKCKRLKEAGFPQKGHIWYFGPNGSVKYDLSSLDCPFLRKEGDKEICTLTNESCKFNWENRRSCELMWENLYAIPSWEDLVDHYLFTKNKEKVLNFLNKYNIKLSEKKEERERVIRFLATYHIDYINILEEFINKTKDKFKIKYYILKKELDPEDGHDVLEIHGVLEKKKDYSFKKSTEFSHILYDLLREKCFVCYELVPWLSVEEKEEEK